SRRLFGDRATSFLRFLMPNAQAQGRPKSCGCWLRNFGAPCSVLLGARAEVVSLGIGMRNVLLRSKTPSHHLSDCIFGNVTLLAINRVEAGQRQAGSPV